jgi:hypothetical protein
MTIDRTLEEDGFVLVGHITLQLPSMFVVDFEELPKAQWWAPVIYAFRIGGEVVRIGKSENVLGMRIRQWNRDVPRALAGDFRIGGTNPWEALEWRARLTSRRGEFLAQIVCGDRDRLRHHERELINYYDPILCNDGPCSRGRPPEARSVKNVKKAKAYWKSLNRQAP